MAIVILNAPPHSGKDTIANLLVEKYSFTKLEFKQRIYEIAKAILGDSFGKLQRDLSNRDAKEAPQDYLGSLSPRQFLIKISEDWIKPVFGDDYFGVAAAEAAAKARKGHVVFSDGGFPDEILPLRELGVPVLVIRLRREGYDFSSDSRKYLPEYLGHCTLDLPLIEGKPEAAVQEVLGLIDFLNHTRIFQSKE